eukprot:NODE_1089_length_1105_cov_86.891098_g288_i1.p1 GENE.NODE_1089_length_1105_cov_86.891098_g288_i1~~NODE_1089_length_1105_cov_86.891098_g288_i1.p1  ORF type:complete len:210 (+),score=44.08 NODE_1089_length_1105_cov_86.891098_g288_i1:352-981(+)
MLVWQLSATMTSHEDLVFISKLAEQAERYDEMVECMTKVVKSNPELTVEERNLLSVAFKNIIGSRRASWRIIGSIEAKEEQKGNADHVRLIKEYKKTVQKELSGICDDIINLMEGSLIPAAQTGEAKVFFLKMKGTLGSNVVLGVWKDFVCILLRFGQTYAFQATTTVIMLKLMLVRPKRTMRWTRTPRHPKLPPQHWHQHTPSVWGWL